MKEVFLSIPGSEKKELKNILVDISVLVGKTITEIINEDNKKIIFYCQDKTNYIMYHNQECCETVELIDTINSFDDILNTPILKATEDVKEGKTDNHDIEYTFYNIATIKGFINLRWHGYSDSGCYATNVNFEEIKKI